MTTQPHFVLPDTTLKPEQVQELLRNSTPGPWSAFHKSKYDEWHVSVPLGDGSQMSLGLFPDGVPTAHPEADGQLIALAPELAQGYVELHAAVPTPEQAAEVEGLRAALGGCVGTHNPHVFGDPALREAWARGMRQVHAYRDRELEIQAGRLPLQELRTLLRSVFLGAEGQDINREAGRLFDKLAHWPLLPALEASGGAGKVVSDDTPERSDS